nr:MAG TPA: hypothetical protein [Bacteriophage sp.]
MILIDYIYDISGQSASAPIFSSKVKGTALSSAFRIWQRGRD